MLGLEDIEIFWVNRNKKEGISYDLFPLMIRESIDSENLHYVYLHMLFNANQSIWEAYYVGNGVGDRDKQSLRKNANDYDVNPDDIAIVHIGVNLDKKEAEILEGVIHNRYNLPWNENKPISDVALIEALEEMRLNPDDFLEIFKNKNI